MEIPSILLGITMTVLAVAVYLAKRDRDALMAQVNALTERVIVVEKRRTMQVAEPTADAKTKKTVLRTWNEDAEAAS